MKIAKRIFLFLIINFLIIFTISIIISVFKLQSFITAFGLNYQSLLIFCLLWGFLGSFISLLLSKKIAKWMMKVKIISLNSQDPKEKEILEILQDLIKNSSFKKIPEIGIYPSKEVNAFATGPCKNNSMIALSSGLLENMSKEEIKGVLAHELSHISNGDMVTMTLIQGIVNSFVLFLARALAYILSSRGRNNNNFSYMSYMLFVFLFQFIFMVLGSMVIAFFSRKREYKADFKGAQIAGKTSMIEALRKLQSLKNLSKKDSGALQTLKISNFSKCGLFSTHPPLEKRIQRLQNV